MAVNGRQKTSGDHEPREKKKPIHVTVARCTCGWIRTFEDAWIPAERAARFHEMGHRLRCR